jgi:hypothetical protein
LSTSIRSEVMVEEDLRESIYVFDVPCRVSVLALCT